MVRGFKKLILLLQSGCVDEPYIIVIPQKTEFDSNGGDTIITITIKSDIEWNITID